MTTPEGIEAPKKAIGGPAMEKAFGRRRRWRRGDHQELRGGKKMIQAAIPLKAVMEEAQKLHAEGKL